MLIVLKKKSDNALISHIQELLKQKYNCQSHLIGENKRVIAVPGDTAHVDVSVFKTMEGVASVDRVSPPYKLASRRNKDRTEITLKPGITIGGRSKVVVMAGPCSIESAGQLDECVAMVHGAGLHVLRGGAFKPRTGPYSFNGMGEEGLKLMQKAAEKYNMATISEAMNEEQITLMEDYVDIIQIGARNMQNYDLLRRAGKSKKAIMLKRGLSATLEEFLLAAEYILAGGNHNVILCERGIRTFEDEVRFTLCLGSVSPLRELTHLPIVVDPSHAAGRARWVADNARGGVAVGADGLIIEVHPEPEKALSDAAQQLNAERFTECMQSVKAIAAALGKEVI
jgi:3-deoxy-7-phosphoheptulonate synthase